MDMFVCACLYVYDLHLGKEERECMAWKDKMRFYWGKRLGKQRIFSILQHLLGVSSS